MQPSRLVCDWLERLTREERLAQLQAAWAGPDPQDPRPFSESTYLDRLAERYPHGVGFLTRPAGSGAPGGVSAAATRVRATQAWLGARDYPGAIVHDEAITGLLDPEAAVTASPLALAATFDPGAAEQAGLLAGTQAAAAGVHHVLAPVLDVARDQRWGRVEETFGEDPLLVATMGAAWIRGVHAAGVAATGKHFVAHGASRGGHNTAPVDAGPRSIAEVHLPPWRAAFAAGLDAVMAAYHALDGVPVHVRADVVSELLRGRLGFDGVVVSDYWALDELVTVTAVAADRAAAARAALLAGVDVDLPRGDCVREVAAAADAGEDPELWRAVDSAVARVLAWKERLGLLPPPRGSMTILATPRRSEPADSGTGAGVGDEALAATAAAACVLVENDGVLPLRVGPGSTVAVIGAHADDPRLLSGNYSWRNHMGYAAGGDGGTGFLSALDAAIRERGGSVRHAAGFPPSDAGRLRLGAEGPPPASPDDVLALQRDAVALAAGCEAAVVVVGDLPGHFGRGTVGEGSDRRNLRICDAQRSVLAALAATGIPTVALLACGRGVDLDGVVGSAGAVLACWFPGDAGVTGVVDVVLGVREPGGRLPVTFGPAGAQPLSYDHAPRAGAGYGGDDAVGQPAVDAPERGSVRWFGYGGTYTTFARRWLRRPHIGEGGRTVHLSMAVANRGSRAGTDVVQVYARATAGAGVRPVRGRLVAFARVLVEPGDERTLDISFDTDSLAEVDVAGGRRRTAGTVDVRVASHAGDPGLAAAVELVEDGSDVPERAAPGFRARSR